ncbi:hypothetical protein HO663_04925 [Streptococcus suis]|uniref:hypothetical protein n=1 Tax=Streptococcus suis TaxID=1307 RepID=UPI0003A4ADDE|nr:hypothetical protein [Streptococcus suis]MBY4959857.1 hypothetical protein [Streptococcus suis]MBY5027287.1 hypothetical protein [Streptococcus suis]MBY6287587.1 hypothetical protein [Streptococcus suis]MBY6294754.1 hypothetical protein [Streptococcus suis]MCQ9224016.1 hypothetical protein [Streptococcus suis]
MKKEFIEKIAQVKIVHDDSEKTEFSQFYSTSKFPINFDLQVSVTFLNIIPDKLYRLKIDIMADTTQIKIIQSDSQFFSISEKDMILVHENLGQSFIMTGIQFDVLQENAYKITFTLSDENDVELSSFSNYYYFGEVSG